MYAIVFVTHRIAHDFLLFGLNEEMDLHVNGISLTGIYTINIVGTVKPEFRVEGLSLLKAFVRNSLGIKFLLKLSFLLD